VFTRTKQVSLSQNADRDAESSRSRAVRRGRDARMPSRDARMPSRKPTRSAMEKSVGPNPGAGVDAAHPG
jgi:hypothetical protein